MGDKTAPQVRLEEFWEELEKRSEIKISDIDKLRELLGGFVVRCNQFVDEARASAKSYRKRYEDLKNES